MMMGGDDSRPPDGLSPVAREETSELRDRAVRHLRDVLTQAFEFDPSRSAAFVVADFRSPLSRLLAEAYRLALPAARRLDFDALPAADILAALSGLSPGDLVVLVQSGNFRLAEFRLRVELFARGLKVIEHPHLERMEGPELGWYVDALAYDAAYYRGTGAALKSGLDAARLCRIETGAGSPLVFPGPFEEAKLNVGDYRGMRNTGGLYPIGEVFTEAADLEAVSGRARIDIFADLDFRANRPAIPVTIEIEKGRVIAARDGTPEFDRVLDRIRADEGDVWVRELGFGLNRAFTRERMIRDIGTLERMCGVHLSLGAKHAVYKNRKKPVFRHRPGGTSGLAGSAVGLAEAQAGGAAVPIAARHHVDVFLAVETVFLDDAIVFRDGAWAVPPL